MGRANCCSLRRFSLQQATGDFCLGYFRVDLSYDLLTGHAQDHVVAFNKQTWMKCTVVVSKAQVAFCAHTSEVKDMPSRACNKLQSISRPT